MQAWIKANYKSKVLKKEFSEVLDYIVEGDCGRFSKPSTIIDIVTGKEIRP